MGIKVILRIDKNQKIIPVRVEATSVGILPVKDISLNWDADDNMFGEVVLTISGLKVSYEIIDGGKND